MTDAKQAFASALDWLEQHPDQHITGMMAAASPRKQRIASTRAPEATCFCALGRFAHEMGIDTYFSKEAAQPLVDAGLIYDARQLTDMHDYSVFSYGKPETLADLRSLIQ